ncbi:MAG: FecR domain-containing protein [Bradyrhizobium sp.]|nr:FecR domain-containing protein [Bradyrhizobium sp.]
MRHRLSLVTWLAFLLLGGATGADAKTVPIAAGPVPVVGTVTSGLIRLAQAAPAPAAAPAEAQPADDEPIGNVATLTGTATVTRHNAQTPLKLQDDIFLNDVLRTSANSTLGVTFNDATTFNLTANARITVDNYVYQEGGKHNSALFDIAKGTVAFVAAEVAHSGDMKISTPTATLGIRGTTGLVEVPQGAAANNPNNVAIKLYPDADGRVGRIEVNDRNGVRLGALTQGSSGFTIRRGAGGRFTATALVISPQQALRDQGIVHQVHAAQNVGRQIVTRQRALRQANPNRNHLRNNPARRPGLQRQNGLPQRPGSPQAPRGPERQNQNRQEQNRQDRVRPPTGAPHAVNGPAVRQPGPPQHGLQRPGFANRPALQRRPAPRGKPQKEKR